MTGTPRGLPPRFHNALSYGVAALVLPVVLALRSPGGLPPWAVSLPAALWCAHFLRRCGEALFVHRYGGRPIPPGDFLVEYIYYWGFGTWIAVSLPGPSAGLGAAGPGDVALAVGLVGFLGAEAGNARYHWRLRQLRPPEAPVARVLPVGGLFRWVSSPHYLFEILSWGAFAWLTRVWASVAFLGLGAGILATYAWQRHRRYQRDFDGLEGRPRYPRDRRALVPYLF